MKIYTKKGDLGKTSIIGESNIDKHHLRIEAYGTIDELNSQIGLLKSCPCLNEHKYPYIDQLVSIQNHLFAIGSLLASKSAKLVNPPWLQMIEEMEKDIDSMELILLPLTDFILPGGDIWSSYAHIARSICRRAERRVTAFHEHCQIEKNILVYLNRLSDYLFVLARLINKLQNIDDVTWNK